MAKMPGILHQKRAGKACKKHVLAAKNDDPQRNNAPLGGNGMCFGQTGTLL
jgi:hypothetical protein